MEDGYLQFVKPKQSAKPSRVAPVKLQDNKILPQVKAEVKATEGCPAALNKVKLLHHTSQEEESKPIKSSLLNTDSLMLLICQI